nr:hypothetical protein [Bdellovibrionales bacterium]
AALLRGGKRRGEAHLADLKGTVRGLKPYPGKILTLDLENGYFVPANPEDLKDATALEVTAQSKAKVDKVRFSIQKRQP